MKITTELIIDKIDRLIASGKRIMHDANLGNSYTHHKFFIGDTITVLSINSKDINTIEIRVNHKQIISESVDYLSIYNYVMQLCDEQNRKFIEKEQQEIYNYLTNDN